MANKYHISKTTHRPNICVAKGACPIGGEHFDNKDDARAYIEKELTETHGITKRHSKKEESPELNKQLEDSRTAFGKEHEVERNDGLIRFKNGFTSKAQNYSKAKRTDHAKIERILEKYPEGGLNSQDMKEFESLVSKHWPKDTFWRRTVLKDASKSSKDKSEFQKKLHYVYLTSVKSVNNDVLNGWSIGTTSKLKHELMLKEKLNNNNGVGSENDSASSNRDTVISVDRLKDIFKSFAKRD